MKTVIPEVTNVTKTKKSAGVAFHTGGFSLS